MDVLADYLEFDVASEHTVRVRQVKQEQRLRALKLSSKM